MKKSLFTLTLLLLAISAVLAQTDTDFDYSDTYDPNSCPSTQVVRHVWFIDNDPNVKIRFENNLSYHQETGEKLCSYIRSNSETVTSENIVVSHHLAWTYFYYMRTDLESRIWTNQVQTHAVDTNGDKTYDYVQVQEVEGRISSVRIIIDPQAITNIQFLLINWIDSGYENRTINIDGYSYTLVFDYTINNETTTYVLFPSAVVDSNILEYGIREYREDLLIVRFNSGEG